jgi:2-keto-4-pentenoate hydratase
METRSRVGATMSWYLSSSRSRIAAIVPGRLDLAGIACQRSDREALMNETTLAEAVQAVVNARLGRGRLGRLTGVDSLEDGYAVQQLANRRLEASLGQRTGHKIGGTTETMRRYINVPEPLAGEVFASQCVPSGATVGCADHVRLGIETEIAVTLGKALPPRERPYGRDDVADAVASVHAAIELVDDRYDSFATIGGPTLIADNAFDAGSVLGEPVADWRGLDLGALTARTVRDGSLLATGRSDALLGHPLDALTWLANRRGQLGLGLAAGTFVSLGTITPVVWVDGPASFHIEVEGLGSVDVTAA